MGIPSIIEARPALKIVAYGRPAPQGSKRHVGHGIMVESSGYVKPWREAVKCAAIEAMGDIVGVMFAGPVWVNMTFTVTKPKSAPKNRVTYPDRMPDLSKLVRATEDALTEAGVWEDDARIIALVSAKVYPNEGENSLSRPGVVIKVGNS